MYAIQFALNEEILKENYDKTYQIMIDILNKKDFYFDIDTALYTIDNLEENPLIKIINIIYIFQL